MKQQRSSGGPPARIGGHRPNKRFGQNFLHDPGVISRIMRAIAPRRDDRLVEIGPGLGALTGPLLQAVEGLHVVELDHSLIPRLLDRLGHPTSLTVHAADALTVDYGALAAGAGGPLRVVGNLPYNISTPLLFHLMRHAGHILDMHFMLQKEVVTRMVAAPGGRDYGRLTVTLAARARCEALFDVGPGAFHPPPKVTSSIVRVTPHQHPLDIDLDAFDRVVTAAFSQRRKTLSNSLGRVATADQIRAADIDPGVRAETLSLDDYLRLTRVLYSTSR